MGTGTFMSLSIGMSIADSVCGMCMRMRIYEYVMDDSDGGSVML